MEEGPTGAGQDGQGRHPTAHSPQPSLARMSRTSRQRSERNGECASGGRPRACRGLAEMRAICAGHRAGGRARGTAGRLGWQDRCEQGLSPLCLGPVGRGRIAGVEDETGLRQTQESAGSMSG